MCSGVCVHHLSNINKILYIYVIYIYTLVYTHRIHIENIAACVALPIILLCVCVCRKGCSHSTDRFVVLCCADVAEYYVYVCIYIELYIKLFVCIICLLFTTADDIFIIIPLLLRSFSLSITIEIIGASFILYFICDESLYT